jgi:hypothetical protein
MGLLVNPAESRSGLTVNTTQGLDSVFLTNRYRRPGYCFIDRVSVFNADNKEIPSPEKLAEFPVAEVTGVSGYTSSLVNAVMGNMAYEEKSTEPIALPIPTVEGAVKARYRLCVVGPSIKLAVVDPDWNSLTDYEKQKHDDITDKFLVTELFMRFVLSMLLSSNKIDDYVLFIGAGDLYKNLWKLATNEVPKAFEMARKGQIKEAGWTIVNAFMTNSTFRAMALQQLLDGIEKAYGVEVGAEAAEAAQKVMAYLRIVDKFLVAFDSSVIAANLSASHDADIWDIIVTRTRVVLRPASVDLVEGQEVTFLATVPEQSGSGVNLEYTWTNTATSGHLTDGLSGHADAFVSSRNSATYKAGSTGDGTDTVTVEVRMLAGPAQSAREYVGTATARIGRGNKDPRLWILSGGEDPNAEIDVPIDIYYGGLILKLNGKAIPGLSAGRGQPLVFTAKPGDSLEVKLVEWAAPGDSPWLGALWLHQWDGAKKVKLKDYARLNTWNTPKRAGVDTMNRDDLDVYYAQTFTIPYLAIDPVELAYDDGNSDGGVSLGGRAQYGFQVGYTASTYFKVAKIRIYSWIKSAPSDGSQFTVWLGDKYGDTMWKGSFPFTLFTTEHAWLELEVPNQVMDKEFFVRLYAPTIGEGAGPFIGADQSGTNTHSEMISKYQKDVQTGYKFQLVEWSLKEPQKAKTNWMIRVDGNVVATYLRQ